VDLQLVLKRRSTGDVIFSVGGRWDRVDNKYVGNAERSHTVLINEAQMAGALCLKAWLEKRLSGQDREILHLYGVKRGGGKSHMAMIALAVIAVAIPGAVTWAVNPSHSRRDEIERIFRGQIPKWLGWWLYRSQPEFRFTWINGSALRLISGEIPETVRQGGAEAVLLNELQDMDRRVFSLGLPATRNAEGRPAGLMIIAANPPTRARGEFIVEIVEKIQGGQIEGKYLDFDPKLNASVEQRALDKIANAIEQIDPSAARADLSGLWLPVGERAYPMWRAKTKIIDEEIRQGLVGELPELGYTDVTNELLKKVGCYRSSGRVWVSAVTADFQGRPHMAALSSRIYRGPDGKLFYYVRHEFIAKGNEADLSDEIQDRSDVTPDNAVIIGDASGAWQSGKDRRNAPPSFDALKANRWTVIPPTDKKRDDSTFAKNPPVDLSLGEVYMVMRESRLLVHPDCKWLIEALEKCPLKREGVRPVIPAKGGYSHITDCLRYLIARFEAKPAAPRHFPRPGQFTSVTLSGGGPRIL
jgi:hypothetical protein